MKRSSIRARLRVHFLGLTALLLGAFAGLLYVAVRRSLIEGLDADLRARATALAALVERDGGGWEVELEDAEQPSPDLVRNLTAWAVATDPGGIPLLVSPGFGDRPAPAAPTAFAPDGPERVRPVELAGACGSVGRERAFTGVFAVREEAAAADGGPEPGEIRAPVEPGAARVRITVFADLEPVDGALRALGAALAAVGAATLLAAAGLAALVARRIVGPLARIAEDAESVRAPDSLATIRGSGRGDEIDRLAATLNDTFHRLREAYARQMRFTADASHELRTPVSAIRTRAEVALRRERPVEHYRRALATVGRQAERLGQRIEGLLTLARLDSGRIGAALEPVRLDELAREGLAELRPAAEAEGVDLRVATSAAGRVRADRRLLGVALRNLLSNALRHCARPGSIEIRVTEAGEHAALEVRDDGGGIPDDALPHVFERFYRTDPARGSESGAAGLGLSIVAEIVRLHGGSVDAGNAPGGGATFRIRLPRLVR